MTANRTQTIAAESVNELCALWDRAFVRCAYRTILGREADPEGERQFTAQLRLGMSKSQIIHSLRFSSEGEALNVELPGLRRRMKKTRIYYSNLFKWLRLRRSGEYSNSRSARAKRRAENSIARLSDEQERILKDVGLLSARVSRFGDRLNQLESAKLSNGFFRKPLLSIEQMLGSVE